MDHTASENVAGDAVPVAAILLLGGLLMRYAPYGQRLSVDFRDHLFATTGKPGRQLVIR